MNPPTDLWGVSPESESAPHERTPIYLARAPHFDKDERVPLWTVALGGLALLAYFGALFALAVS